MSIEIYISSSALAISFISAYVAWQTKKNTELWQQHDLAIREEKEYKTKAKPYIELINKIYFDLDPILLEFSTKANHASIDIANFLDGLDNGVGSKIHALRHHLVYAYQNVIDSNKDDILFQNPESLLFTQLSKYAHLDYYLDLQEIKNDEVKQHLKILNECVKEEDRLKFFDFANEKLLDVFQVYEKNKVLIDDLLSTMEKKYARFRRYDFGNNYGILHQDFRELLNLLRYIKSVSSRKLTKGKIEFKNVAISMGFFELLIVMIVNDGILKLSRLKS